jgi:hypothetical protein
VTSPLTLSDDFPVLLGPVRVETRFTATELLVRVFPDEWMIDAFEPKPTRAEITALDAYWAAHWRAGGNAVAERAAWQELAARIPVGRATFLLEGRQPANPAEQPTAVPAGTAVLVVVTPAPPAANDRQPTITYWTAIWRAHGDRQRIREADVALLAAVGAGRASAIRARRPVGVDAAPTTTGDAVVVAFLVLPEPRPQDLAPRSWTVAATAKLLPDRFAVLGYVGEEQVLSATGGPILGPLAVSVDPLSADKPKINEATGALHVPAALRWLTDFAEAVRVGMGVRIPLTDAIRDGLDRLVVLGVRGSAAPDSTATALTELLRRQLHSPAGLSLLPQGTATNNSDQAPAGQDVDSESEAGRRVAAGFTTGNGWLTRSDGQWFAELLGIDPARLAGMPGADGTDQAEARAANIALWPATWGSYLRSTLHPLLDAETVAETSEFFVRNVSGRGPLPVVKIGRQPYGIVPTTAFSRMAWPATAAHRRGLHRVLEEATEDWRAVAHRVVHLGSPGADPHQDLLDILALHPTSAEYHQRYAQSVDELFNRRNLRGEGSAVLDRLEQLQMAAPVRAVLARFGAGNADPDVLRRLFVESQHPLLAPLVAETNSETEPLRPEQNYLRWLATVGGTSLDVLRTETGLTRPPTALLYFLVRHALLLGWADAARSLAIRAGVADAVDLQDRDPVFVHVDDLPVGDVLRSESRFRRLYSKDVRITGDPDRTVATHIAQVLGQNPDTAALAAQLDAIDTLAGLPTARLERLLVEHLDCATYRLDAWRLGLATERLTELRYPGAGSPRRGVHIGAYGWLEDVRPRTDELTPVPLSGKLAEVFGPDVMADARNGGYVHTPSPAHARTAAVLRAGYVANREPESSVFAVNLTSERVRTALAILDGLRQGQSLGALLGYRFERGLHEGHPDVELDTFIAPLRAAFPLRFGRIPETAPAGSGAFEQVEARNVVDGLELHRTVTRTSHTQYPFGKAGLPPNPTTGQKDAIQAEVENLKAVHDALADLAVAEGVHQALAGNAERASATLDAFAKDGFPPEPAVVETPQSGTTLTHRLALALRPGLAPPGSAGPRAKAEPAVDDWLPALLPPAAELVVQVSWTDPNSGGKQIKRVSQAELGLQPIDLLATLRPGSGQAMTDLEDRIVGVVTARDRPRPDAELTIEFTERVPGKITFFEVSPLVGTLRTLLTTARPLRSSDLVPATSATLAERSADQAVSVPRARPAAVLEALAALGGRVGTYIADVAALYPAAGPNTAQIVQGIDDILTRYAGLVGDAGRFGMVRSGWGEVVLWRRGVFGDVLRAVAGAAERMGRALAEADTLLAAYDALPSATPDAERFRRLTEAERLLTTTPTVPRPARPRDLREVLRTRRRDFNTRLQALLAIARTTRSTLSGLMADVSALLPLTAFDPIGLDLAEFRRRIVTFGADLLDRARALDGDIADRRRSAGEALGAYDAAVTGPDRVAAAETALTAMLGEDVLFVPEFTPPQELADEWRAAQLDSDGLLAHLRRPDDSLGDFPVDTWLHGVARVREAPRLWERAVLLADALLGGGGLLGLGAWTEPPLSPIQLPHREDDAWLGMDFRRTPPTSITEDKLLLTAHYATAATTGSQRCGLLFDEWTEVVPADRETTGIAVHVDAPGAEPPQAMLLVVPPDKTGPSGQWKSADLVDAITETFEMARLRAVEPAHLDGTAYAQLLPATLMSATRAPITISTDLAVANLRWKATHD